MGTEHCGMILYGMIFTLLPMQPAAPAPRRKVPSLIPIQNQSAVLYLPPWKQGQPAAQLDVSVTSPMQQPTISQASVTQGHALSVGGRQEDRCSCCILPISWSVLYPLCYRILGGWSDTTSDTIRSM